MSYRDKLKELYIDEEEIMCDLIEKAKFIFRVSKSSAEIVFKVSLVKLSDYQKIILYMLGAMFLNDLEKRESKEVTNQELTEFLKKRKEAVASRLSELRNMKKIKSIGTGKNMLVPYAIVEDIEEIIGITK